MQAAGVVGLIYSNAVKAGLGREAPNIDGFRYNPQATTP